MNRNNLPTLPYSRRTARKSGNDETPIIVAALKNSLFGLLASVLTGLLLVTVATFIAYSNPDPDALLTPLALASMVPAAFIGGFTNGKVTRSSPMLCGIINGLWLVVFFLMASFLTSSVPSSGYLLWQTLLLHLAAVALSVIGAFMGTRQKKIKPGMHRHPKRR